MNRHAFSAIVAKLRDIEEAELADDKWERAQLRVLLAINSNIVHVGRLLEAIGDNMATEEQVAALNTAIDELETATETEIGQINARIDELIAAAGGTVDPALDAAVARLQAQRDRIAGIIPDAPAEG